MESIFQHSRPEVDHKVYKHADIRYGTDFSFLLIWYTTRLSRKQQYCQHAPGNSDHPKTDGVLSLAIVSFKEVVVALTVM